MFSVQKVAEGGRALAWNSARKRLNKSEAPLFIGLVLHVGSLPDHATTRRPIRQRTEVFEHAAIDAPLTAGTRINPRPAYRHSALKKNDPNRTKSDVNRISVIAENAYDRCRQVASNTQYWEVTRGHSPAFSPRGAINGADRADVVQAGDLCRALAGNGR
jgi:hypothetical protein